MDLQICLAQYIKHTKRGRIDEDIADSSIRISGSYVQELPSELLPLYGNLHLVYAIDALNLFEGKFLRLSF